MQVNPNYSQVKNDFEPLPEGTYFVRVDSFKVNKDDAAGKPLEFPVINWTLKVFGHPKYNARSLFLNTEIGGEHAFVLQRFVRAAVPEYTGGSFRTEDVVGKKMEVLVVHSKGKKDGNIFANVRNPVPYIEQGSAGSFEPGAAVPGDVPNHFGDAPALTNAPSDPKPDQNFGFGP